MPALVQGIRRHTCQENVRNRITQCSLPSPTFKRRVLFSPSLESCTLYRLLLTTPLHVRWLPGCLMPTTIADMHSHCYGKAVSTCTHAGTCSIGSLRTKYWLLTWIPLQSTHRLWTRALSLFTACNGLARVSLSHCPSVNLQARIARVGCRTGEMPLRGMVALEHLNYHCK